MQKTLTVINLQNIRRNALRIKKLAFGAKFYAVVKADAYGHGAEEVARYIEDVADGFCVAVTEEGTALRVAGISKEILVLTPPLNGYDVERCAFYNLTPTVNSVETASLICGMPCHIKVNTGMNRNGCNLNELYEILKILPPENILGVYSHLFAPQDTGASLRQLNLFKSAEKLVKEYSPQAISHISASGGLLRGGEFLMDGVRCGILLYGYAPDGFKKDGFEGAMKVYARKVQSTKFIGGGVGYNFAEKSYGSLSTYRLGYADGFRRTVPLGEKTLCMDSFVSERSEELLPVFEDADEYAKRCKTISYEVLTNVTKRTERVYVR